jgi:hypothetical protein
MQTASFTPLSGGRYRCNQTGDIVSKKQLDSYRSAFEKNSPAAASQVLTAAKHKPLPKEYGGHKSRYRNKG